MTGYKALAAAIVERALIDYKEALKSRDTAEQRILKKFFRSNWFDVLSDLNAEALMAQLERMVRK